MSNQLLRRTFLLGWLGSLLAGCLGRSQASAAPAPPPPAALRISLTGRHTVTLNWTVVDSARLRSPSISCSTGQTTRLDTDAGSGPPAAHT